MKFSTQRTLLRWLHLLLGFPIIGYIYGPVEEVAQYAPMYRYFIVPVLILSGFWMWKGDALLRAFSKKSN